MNKLKRTRFFSLGRKWVFTLALFVLVFAAASVVKVQAASTIMGWLWGGSEDANIAPPASMNNIDGNETGVGKISMNNSDPAKGAIYSVNIDDFGNVSGYAWANASDNPNSTVSHEENGLGWIDFNSRDHCVPITGVVDPAKQQYKAANCMPPRGCSNVVRFDRMNHIFTGCARMVSIAQASVTGNNGGWDGWIKMSGTAKDGSAYGVNIEPGTGKFCAPEAPTTKEYDSVSGKYHCFAWSGEESLTVTATQKNMANGLGWIDFAGASIEEVCTIAFDSASKTLNENSSGSAVLSEVGTNCKCKNVKIESMNTSVADGVSPTAANFFADIKPDSANISFNTKSVGSSTYFPGVIKASSDDCGQDLLDLSLLNVPACTVSARDSVTVLSNSYVDYDVTVTGGDSECSTAPLNCSKASGDSNISVENIPGEARKCRVRETAGERYGTAVSHAQVGAGLGADTKVNVKGPGWVETNP